MKTVVWWLIAAALPAAAAAQDQPGDGQPAQQQPQAQQVQQVPPEQCQAAQNDNRPQKPSLVRDAAGATAHTVGAMAGGAVAGPIGAAVGGAVVDRAGHAVKKVVRRGKKKRHQAEQQAQAQRNGADCDGRQPS